VPRLRSWLRRCPAVGWFDSQHIGALPIIFHSTRFGKVAFLKLTRSPSLRARLTSRILPNRSYPPASHDKRPVRHIPRSASGNASNLQARFGIRIACFHCVRFGQQIAVSSRKRKTQVDVGTAASNGLSLAPRFSTRSWMEMQLPPNATVMRRVRLRFSPKHACLAHFAFHPKNEHSSPCQSWSTRTWLAGRCESRPCNPSGLAFILARGAQIGQPAAVSRPAPKVRSQPIPCGSKYIGCAQPTGETQASGSPW